MATKKQAEEVLEETKELNEKIQDPWNEEVEMMVPRKSKGDDQQYYVCVNDRRFSIPANGKMQKLPQPIAEVLQAALEAEYEADDFADKITQHASAAPQPNAI